MQGSNGIVKIEQRLQEAGRILLFPVDEGLALLAPAGIGLGLQAPLPGIALGVISFVLWKRFKGDGGLERVLAQLYWYLPRSLTITKTLPDSSVQAWRG